MATNKRQQIVTAIDTRLKTILTANGYETSVGASVVWWAMSPIDQDLLPQILVKDTERILRNDELGIGQHQHILNIAVEIMLKPTYTAAASTMRQVIADLYKCIGVDVTWGGLAEDTSLPVETGLRIEQHEYCLVGVGYNFDVEYITSPWDPYT